MIRKDIRNQSVKALLAGAVLTGLLTLSTGCAPKEAAKPTVIPLPAPSGPATAQPTTSAQSPGGPAASSHMAGMDTGSSASLTPTPDLDAQIAKLQKSGGAAKDLSVLYAQRGDKRMMDNQASPHVKYAAALSDFRKAIALDPTNKHAASNKLMIEAIYKGMGRPIPTE